MVGFKEAAMGLGTVRFDRMELAGSLGDLGTLLPLALGMIMINGLNPAGVFWAVGLFYILAGTYYRTPIAVQPMKVVAAFAIAHASSKQEIQVAAMLMALVMFTFGATNLIDWIRRVVPTAVIRGVQVCTGLILAAKGVSFITGTSGFQKILGSGEPYLSLQTIGPLPIGIILGIVFAFLTFRFINNRKYPAGLILILSGLFVGLVLGGWKLLSGISFGLHAPEFFPYGWPDLSVIGGVFLTMVLPQSPMTIGNAVIAYSDLSANYFPESARRATPKALCLSMGMANVLALLFGGMPMCHGAGGLAAHFRFGARTAGSNYIIGGLFVLLALLLGTSAAEAVRLLPFSVLGVLLVFSGLELCLNLMDITERKGMFVIFFMVAATLAANLAVAFIAGLFVARILRNPNLTV